MTKKTSETVDTETGLVSEGTINKVINVRTRRKDGSLRIQFDYSNCPTMAEQHTAHLTNINYLIKKYKPDELAAYIRARAIYKREIIGHDFTQEPSLQDARNITYKLKKQFDALPDDVKVHFKNCVEYYKFIDNPANQQKMIKLGLLTKKEVETQKELLNNNKPNDDKSAPTLQTPAPPAATK